MAGSISDCRKLIPFEARLIASVHSVTWGKGTPGDTWWAIWIPHVPLPVPTARAAFIGSSLTPLAGDGDFFSHQLVAGHRVHRTL